MQPPFQALADVEARSAWSTYAAWQPVRIAAIVVEKRAARRGLALFEAGPAAASDEARLLEWESVVPDEAAAAAGASLNAAGPSANNAGGGRLAADRRSTQLRSAAEEPRPRQ